MRFAVEHATPGRIRIRTADRISLEESRSLRLAILGIEGVTDVRFLTRSCPHPFSFSYTRCSLCALRKCKPLKKGDLP